MNNEKSQIIDKENLFQVLDRNVVWIENCDTKTSIILGGIGVILGIVLASDYVSKIATIFQNMIDNMGFWPGLYIILSIVSMCGIVVGVLFLLQVLVAKTDTHELSDKGISGNSLIFFSSIAKQKSVQDYKAKLMDCSENDWIDEIISQIYICSLICDKKFRNYKIGLILSVSGFALFAAMMIIGVLAL